MLKNFQNKFIENSKLTAKNIVLKEEDIEENKVPDSSEVRRMLMLRRKIIFNIYLASLEDQKMLEKLMKVRKSY